MRIIDSVRDALRDGRQSRQKPWWVMGPHENWGETHQSVRYLWDKDEQFVWVVGIAGVEANVITVLRRRR